MEKRTQVFCDYKNCRHWKQKLCTRGIVMLNSTGRCGDYELSREWRERLRMVEDLKKIVGKKVEVNYAKGETCSGIVKSAGEYFICIDSWMISPDAINSVKIR